MLTNCKLEDEQKQDAGHMIVTQRFIGNKLKPRGSRANQATICAFVTVSRIAATWYSSSQFRNIFTLIYGLDMLEYFVFLFEWKSR